MGNVSECDQHVQKESILRPVHRQYDKGWNHHLLKQHCIDDNDFRRFSFPYVIFEINLYYISLKKKTSERLLFLVFLLQLNLIGYVGDSIYLIPVFLFLMIANAVYQTSNRPNDAIVHQEFFDHFVQESNLDKR